MGSRNRHDLSVPTCGSGKVHFKRLVKRIYVDHRTNGPRFQGRLGDGSGKDHSIVLPDHIRMRLQEWSLGPLTRGGVRHGRASKNSSLDKRLELKAAGYGRRPTR